MDYQPGFSAVLTHRFHDGNGRTTQTLTAWLLYQDGYDLVYCQTSKIKMSLRVNPPRKNEAQTGRNSISCHCHTPLLKLIRPRGRFYGRSSRVNFPLKSSRGLRDTYSIYYLLQQSHFVGSIIFFPAGGFFEKFTINHLPSPKPTTALSNIID